MNVGVARKITFGTAALLLLWSTLVVVVLTGLYAVHGALRDLSDHREPLHHATLDLEINVNGVMAAVLKYMDRPEQRWEEFARTDHRDGRCDRGYSLLTTNPRFELGWASTFRCTGSRWTPPKIAPPRRP